MAIKQPSQYDCDNMKPGDMIIVQNRNKIYKLIRKYFCKNKLILKVRKDFSEDCNYEYYYQEDCTLMYEHELKCVQSDEDVACLIGFKNVPIKVLPLKQLDISLYNVRLIFKSGLSFTFPLSHITNMINRNNIKLKEIDNFNLIRQQLQNQKYKGDYFKKYVKDNNIKSFESGYCNVCGKPMVFNFCENEIIIDNQCECGYTKFNINNMDYDTFSVWCNSQTVPQVIERYNRFWFKKEVIK